MIGNFFVLFIVCTNYYLEIIHISLETRYFSTTHISPLTLNCTHEADWTPFQTHVAMYFICHIRYYKPIGWL
jgi:hypothetical protein